MPAHLATMTLKRTRGKSCTQMGKSSMPALPRQRRAHMFSQDLRLMLVTVTLLGLSASSQLMSSFTGVLSMDTCSNMHSKKALKLKCFSVFGARSNILNLKCNIKKYIFSQYHILQKVTYLATLKIKSVVFLYLLLSTIDRNLGSEFSHPAMFLSSSSRKLMSSA